MQARIQTHARSLVWLIGAAVFLNYIDRGAIGVAAPLMKADLHLSATQFGLAVSAFFWIYAPIQVVIGWLCDRVSVYRLYGFGLLLWSLATALTGLVGGLAGLIVLRIVMGLGESVAFPGGAKLIARHVPPDKRGQANAVLSAGLAFGPAAGTLLGGMILAHFGWRAIFVAFGMLTLAWLLPWEWTLRHLVRERATKAEPPFPLGSLLGLPQLWLSSIGHFTANWGLFFTVTWLPLFLVTQRHFGLQQMTLLASLAYGAQGVVSLLAGRWSDALIARGKSADAVRRGFCVASHIGVAIGVGGLAISQNAPALAFWLALTGGSIGLIYPNMYGVAQTFAGARASGTWIGVANTIGSAAGIIGPSVTGVLIDRTGTFTAAFALSGGVAALGALWWGLVLPRIEPVVPD